MRSANSKRPRQRSGRPPGVLCIEVQIEEVIRLGIGERKCLGGGGSHSINELRQGRISNDWNPTLTEIVVIQPQDSSVGAKPQFVRTDAPRQIVVDEEPGSASALNPSVIQATERGEGCVGSAALQYDRKCIQRLLKISRTEQTFIPGKSGIEIVHQFR